MKRPSFQFYPADWRNNAKLRRCSEAARGAWMDVLCVLHDMDEYGICRWPLADLARSANISLKLVKELVNKDVLKGADKNAEPYIFTPRHAGKDGDPVTLIESNGKPLWYCSRFVRDEYIRQRRGQSTRFDEGNQPPKDEPKYTPKHTIGDELGDGSTSTSSSTSNELINIQETNNIVEVSNVASVCIAMKKVYEENRVAPIDIIHSDQTLLALVYAGASEQEFVDATNLAIQKGVKNIFKYAIGTVRGQRENVKNLNLHQGKMPQTSNRDAGRLAAAKAINFKIISDQKIQEHEVRDAKEIAN